ncbi:(Fe-S)-binding protein [Mailhella massiliensis]|uniref:Glycolate oxidase iron-sulfur subunit n=1 Tax=Mailhella massiliensis TaxID=1903261 RepID=A0A921DRP9_9BACT|nr:(Fe-S)-binding protein [Mailhella massiliensis]HJD97910.1 (Fe-S)-binding protein [Mailhella massiliensis]
MKGPTCEYCGRCLSVCPSYKHHLVETFGPRARIDLARAVAAGELKPGERYHDAIKSCLQCLACTEICGKGVDGAQIILDARLAEGDGRLTLKRRLEKLVTCSLLPRRELMRKMIRACSFFQHVFPLDTRGSIRHLPDALCGAAGKRSMPDLAKKSLFEILPERVMPPDNVTQVGEAALFTGCFGGLVNVEASLALVNALALRGYTVFIPRAQSCCGAPAELSGFKEAFEKAEAHNAEVFAACPDMPVLTLCATCHRTLSREYASSGRELAGRITDAALFLQRHDARTGFAAPMPEKLPAAALLRVRERPVSAADPLVVAVHDPCHFRLDPQVGRAVRRELAAKPWIRLVELKDPGSCCGGGGVSSLKNPALADELGKARAVAVMESGADIVTAQCPGCVLQLNNHLKRQKADARACHTLELIGR